MNFCEHSESQRLDLASILRPLCRVRADRSVLLCCVWLLLGGVANATSQQFTGGVRGLVRDAEGVSAGATVRLTNENTNGERRTVTNDAGQYAFVAVPPGTYTVRTSLPDHRTVVRPGIEIGTQEFITLDLLLEVGAPEDPLTVIADVPSIETANASVASVLDRVMLGAWPSPNRNPFALAVTAPTVVSAGERRLTLQRDQTDSSRISIGGGGIQANNYVLDGVPISDLRGRSLQSPTIEAIQDVRIQVHTYDAEVGRTGGGVFNTTARAGTNAFHGSGFFQTRPVWGQSLDFFDVQREVTKEDVGLTGAVHQVYGGGGGGPIWRNHTFFWAASESYRARRLGNTQELWPTARQRAGDFSTTTVNGAAVRIFNPYCRGGGASAQCPATGPSGTLENPEFANAIIPAFVLNPVALNMAAVWPLPNQDNDDTEPNAIGTTESIDEADMVSFKIEHRFTDGWTLGGLIVYSETREQSPFLMEQPIAATLDRNSGVVQRRPRVLVFNSTNVLSDQTVLTVRAGGASFSRRVAPGTFAGGPQDLGFSSTFVSAIDPAGRSLFPGLAFQNFTSVGRTAGEDERWEQPYAINASLSKLAGRHTFKIGGDARRLSGAVATEQSNAGNFLFNRNFTQDPDGLGGYDFASFLVGAPRAASYAPFNRGDIEVFTRYFGGYFQDDWRVRPNLTINYGVRLEREDGLRELEDRFTVGFDQDVISPLDALVPASARVGTPLEGRTIRGGLIFAGVGGANLHQGDPPTVKVSPRFGLTYALNDRTVIRTGYGLFWAPWNYSTTEHGQIGFTRTTSLTQGSDTTDVPLTTLDDPFPGGLEVPVGSSLGLLTGAGTAIDFVDQTKGAPRIHQYSGEIQYELPGGVSLTVGYVGATGRDIGFGGTDNSRVNINQIPSAVALAAFPAGDGRWDPRPLLQSIPNPFLGIAEAGEFADRQTIQRGQLLRPFPQFRDVNARERTEGSKRQYNAVVLRLDKRIGSSFWGGHFSYTRSGMRDNQFGLRSDYQVRTPTPQNNYDLEAEYGTSNVDSPHRITLAPLLRFPGPAEGSIGHYFGGGWTFAAIVQLMSGASLNAVASSGLSNRNLGLFGGRQRPNLIADPRIQGSAEDRVASAGQADARWFDSDAFEDPGRGIYGNVRRTITDARLQLRKTIDVVFAKNIETGGGTMAQMRFEIINATNTPQFEGPSNAFNLSSFGKITRQLDFPRTWQISFRLSY